eukprot:4448160-Karenia_brevis.AAC.1
MFRPIPRRGGSYRNLELVWRCAGGIRNQKNKFPGQRKMIEFDQYMSEFVMMVERLQKLRTPWLARAPLDDPMRIDESAFRVVDM